jgi:hypothetical protein
MVSVGCVDVDDVGALRVSLTPHATKIAVRKGVIARGRTILDYNKAFF